MAEFTLIAAVGENNSLGKDNDLVWHLPDDFKRFKKLTLGHYIIMGRKTYESMPKNLPGRTSVIITRKEDYKPEDTIVTHSLEKAMQISKEHDSSPFIIGGGEIFEMAIGKADRIELTQIHASFEADTFFPEIDVNKWKLVSSVFHNKDERHKYSFTYLTYERIR